MMNAKPQRRLGAYRLIKVMATADGSTFTLATRPDGSPCLIQIVEVAGPAQGIRQVLRTAGQATSQWERTLSIMDHSAVVQSNGVCTLFWVFPWSLDWIPARHAFWTTDTVFAAARSLSAWLDGHHQAGRTYPTLSEGSIFVDGFCRIAVVGVPIAFDPAWYAPDQRLPRWAPEEAPTGPATETGDLWRLGQTLAALTALAHAPTDGDGMQRKLRRLSSALTAAQPDRRPAAAREVIDATPPHESAAGSKGPGLSVVHKMVDESPIAPAEIEPDLIIDGQCDTVPGVPLSAAIAMGIAATLESSHEPPSAGRQSPIVTVGAVRIHEQPRSRPDSLSSSAPPGTTVSPPRRPPPVRPVTPAPRPPPVGDDHPSRPLRRELPPRFTPAREVVSRAIREVGDGLDERPRPSRRPNARRPVRALDTRSVSNADHSPSALPPSEAEPKARRTVTVAPSSFVRSFLTMPAPSSRTQVLLVAASWALIFAVGLLVSVLLNG